MQPTKQCTGITTWTRAERHPQTQVTTQPHAYAASAPALEGTALLNKIQSDTAIGRYLAGCLCCYTGTGERPGACAWYCPRVGVTVALFGNHMYTFSRLAIAKKLARVLPVAMRLAFRRFSDQSLAVRKRHVRGRDAISHVVVDYFYMAVFQNSYTTVCCSEIDTHCHAGHVDALITGPVSHRTEWADLQTLTPRVASEPGLVAATS